MAGACDPGSWLCSASLCRRWRSRCARTPAECPALRKHGHRAEAKACYQSLDAAADPYVRAEGDWGLELYQDANNEFRAAVAQAAQERALPRALGPPAARALQQPRTPTSSSTKRCRRDPKSAEAYLGLALVSADGFDSKAVAESEGARTRSEARRSPRTAGQACARRLRPGEGRRGGRRGARNLARSARRHGRPRRGRSCWPTARRTRGSRKCGR